MMNNVFSCEIHMNFVYVEHIYRIVYIAKLYRPIVCGIHIATQINRSIHMKIYIVHSHNISNNIYSVASDALGGWYGCGGYSVGIRRVYKIERVKAHLVHTRHACTHAAHICRLPK